VPLPAAEFITDVELERRATALLTEHYGAAGARLPIDIESIVEFTLGLRIVWIDIEEQPGETILARIDPKFHGHATIQMNQKRRDHFERYLGTGPYSQGHEAGHWILHFNRGRSEQLGLAGFMEREDLEPLLCRHLPGGTSKPLDQASRREVQAERFAAYLLMPERLVRRQAAGIELSRPDALKSLAADCGVSRQALLRRLNELKVIRLGVDGTYSILGDGRPGRRRLF
jgi:hypothetical protein